MSGGIRLTSVVLLTFQFIYGTVSSNHDKIVTDLKELVERIKTIANTVTNNIQVIPEKREESRFGSLNNLLDGATNNGPINNVNKDNEIFFNQLSEVFKKENNSSHQVNAVSDDEIAPRGLSTLDDDPRNEESEDEVVKVDEDLNFLKELELYQSPTFNMYDKVGDNKKKNGQRDPSNEKGDDENNAYWVDKEDPQNYLQQGPTVLEQLLKQQKRHNHQNKHDKNKAYLKPNDLTGYAGLFDLYNKYGQAENDFQIQANQPGDFKISSESKNTIPDQNNLQSNHLDTYVPRLPSDLKSQKHTDIRSLSDGVNLDKYSKVYVILNPQALRQPKPKNKVSRLVSGVLSKLLKNKGEARNELKYRDYFLKQNRRHGRRTINVEQIDLSNSGEASADEVSDSESKPKLAPLPKRPKPFKVGSVGSASEGGGSPKVGFGGGQKLGGNKGFKGGKSKENIGRGRLGSRNIESRGSDGGSFGENKGSKGRGGRNRGGGAGRSGGAGRTSIPYIGGGRNIYEKEESKYN